MVVKVAFVHLDLGIGGAERLVVNLACSLLPHASSSTTSSPQYEVTIVTSHHDPARCFDETKPGMGVLGSRVAVHGDWLPRSIMGRAAALCAIVRMLYISSAVIIGHVLAGLGVGSAHRRVDVVVLDGVSAPVPLFALVGIPVVFYCHYPDKLLCTERAGWLKRSYRIVIDTVEEATTGCATIIVVNSSFTARAFHASFPSLSGHFQPQVLYPTIEEEEDGPLAATTLTTVCPAVIAYTAGFDHVLLSLNRYERKKNVGLALEAFAHAKRAASSARLLLVIAGGYDTRVLENVEHLRELKQRADTLGLTHGDGDVALGAATVDVVFRTSIPGAERSALLARATALLYTPDNEHFGIVPLEAMYARTPVVAVASGGPLETVVDGETGFLRPQDAAAFGDAILALMQPPTDAQRTALARRLPQTTPPTQLPRDVPLARLMGLAGRAHVQANFTSGKMRAALIDCLSAAQRGQRRTTPLSFSFTLLLALVATCLFFLTQ